jgi:hypothetical protein
MSHDAPNAIPQMASYIISFDTVHTDKRTYHSRALHIALSHKASPLRLVRLQLEELDQILDGLIRPGRSEGEMFARHCWPDDSSVVLPHGSGDLRDLACGE